jgi:hypothetical protein
MVMEHALPSRHDLFVMEPAFMTWAVLPPDCPCPQPSTPSHRYVGIDFAAQEMVDYIDKNPVTLKRLVRMTGLSELAKIRKFLEGLSKNPSHE